MSDFTHEAWSFYIALITVVSIIACAVLLAALSTRRLPKGEPVIITLPSGDDLDLSLSKHKFRLFWRQGLVLVDKEGNNYLLGLGKNVIGRDVDCEVSLNPSMKDISRKHLIIENLGNNRLKLTDLSSHGTTVTQ